MARKIKSRIKVSGTLIAENPIHVGGMDSNPRVDLPLATNGQGQYYIPGTSLAGTFRSWMESFVNRNNLQALWGFQQENGRGGHASFILVEDAPIQGTVAEIRDGVRINRIWGAAAEQLKYERAILPKGTEIPLNITVDISSKSRDEKSLLTQLLQALENGEIRLGAAKTRGLGKVRLQNLSIQELDFSNRNGIFKILQGKSDSLNFEDLLKDNFSVTKPPQINIQIHWQPQSSLMVKAEGDGIAVDILPLISKFDNHLTFVLPGSSVKGALRTQAERIVRTVCSLSVTEDLLQQLEVPLIDDLFGTRAKANNQSNIKTDIRTNNKIRKGIGAMYIDDCYANTKITSEKWGKVQSVTSSYELTKALDDAELGTIQQAFHVAVDRWTGGAADGFLYSNLEPMGIAWQPINLQFNLKRLQDELKVAAIALIFLVFRDLANNRIPLGYGTNRGMGSIKVTDIVINGHNLDDDLEFLEKIELSNGDIYQLGQESLKKLNQAWQEWINKYIGEHN